MVVVPGKFIFACTPRTASRSVVAALLTVPGAVGKHMHDPPADLLAAKEECGLPIVTFIREPAAQLLSFWWRAFRGGRNNSHIRAKTAVAGRRDRVVQARRLEISTVEVISFSNFIRVIWRGDFLEINDLGHASRARRLSCYHEVADYFFPYELGLRKFFDDWELPIEEIPYVMDSQVHTTPIDRNYITEEHRKVVAEEFPEDVALYEQEMARWLV